MTGIEAGIRSGAACFLICAALAICAMLLFLGGSDDSYAEGGSCGDNLTWDYDGSGKLTIDGTGAMSDWGSDTDVPWNGHANDINIVDIHSGVTHIGGYAFHGCKAPTLTIPEGVVSIGDFALGSQHITSLTLPSTLTSIGRWAINGCGITTLVIPDGVTDVGEDCFGNCHALTSLTIGSGVNNFDGEMLWGSTAMQTVIVHGSNYVIDHNVLYSADMKTAIYYPAGLDDATITIRDGTEIIGEVAFSDVKATDIVIPDSVKRYGMRAFYNSSLKGHLFFFGPNVEYIGMDLWGGSGMPDKMEFHLDFCGHVDQQFCPWPFYKSINQITDIPNGLRGYQFSTMNFQYGNQYNVIYGVVSIEYKYADGTMAAPRVYDHIGYDRYSYQSPEIAGYIPSATDISGDDDQSVIEATVVYSNEMYEVLYYLDGKVVMKSLEFYGYTIDVKPYEAGGISADDWSSTDVTIENGKFVMPNKLVTLTDSPKGVIGPDSGDDGGGDDRMMPITAGVTALAIIAAAAALLLFARRH